MNLNIYSYEADAFSANITYVVYFLAWRASTKQQNDEKPYFNRNIFNPSGHYDFFIMIKFS